MTPIVKRRWRLRTVKRASGQMIVGQISESASRVQDFDKVRLIRAGR